MNRYPRYRARRLTSLLQMLEPRLLFSAAKAAPQASALDILANTQVTSSSEVAFIPAASNTHFVRATIHWGDGKSTQAKVHYGTLDGVSGYEVIGTHTYKKAGAFTVNTQLQELVPQMGNQPGARPGWRHIGKVQSHATVIQQTDATGDQPVDVAQGTVFTATLGHFKGPSQFGVYATVDWGDGTTSEAQLFYDDSGTAAVRDSHFYTQSGIYPIQITVSQALINSGESPIVLSHITNTAIVRPVKRISLEGSMTGTAESAIVLFANGPEYGLHGDATLSALGQFTVSGSVGFYVPIFGFTPGNWGGSLTLTNADGTITLDLRGPSDNTDRNTFPTTFSCTISKSTGAYAGDAGVAQLSALLTLPDNFSPLVPGTFSFSLADVHVFPG